MPIQTNHGKFEVDPNFDEEKYLTERIADVRAFLDKELAYIDTIQDITFQLICMFAMIDCLAQEQTNYPQESWGAKNAFCQFVLKHQKQCDYLEAVEPITLYYRVEDLIDEVEPLPGFPPEKEISLDDLGYLYGDKVKDILPKGKSEEILAYIEGKNGKAFADKMARDHQLISLLYRMRSKAVHEMSGLGEVWHIEEKDPKPAVPYYRDVGRGYVQGEEWVSDNVVELVIPNLFVRNILTDCVDGYLSDCRDMKRLPFSNNHMTRKHKLSWYDK